MAPLATVGILSIGEMGMGIAKLLIAHNYRVVTNIAGRRYAKAPHNLQLVLMLSCFPVIFVSKVIITELNDLYIHTNVSYIRPKLADIRHKLPRTPLSLACSLEDILLSLV